MFTTDNPLPDIPAFVGFGENFSPTVRSNNVREKSAVFPQHHEEAAYTTPHGCFKPAYVGI